MTPFTKIYDAFLSRITDDMYMELTEQETQAMLRELLRNAIHFFEFPRVNLYKIAIDDTTGDELGFDSDLSNEEINIIAVYMVTSWVDQQLASVENVRMKYSGSDFKFTSQANHLAKLMALKKSYTTEGFHLQRLYSRRRVDENGIVRSTISSLREV